MKRLISDSFPKRGSNTNIRKVASNKRCKVKKDTAQFIMIVEISISSKIGQQVQYVTIKHS